MKALLLAAGFGTRLKPLTDRIPKCLVPIGGRPLLDVWLERLTAANCGPFLVNTHYRSGDVAAYVESSRYARRIQLVHEDVLLGTAGTLMANLDFFADDDGMLIHADNYCLADFDGFLRAHRARPRDCLMTMMTFRSDDPTSCGIVSVDERGVVMKFQEKPAHPAGNLANGAVYVLSADLIRHLRGLVRAAVDFSSEVLPQFMGRIFTYETREPLIDVGTARTYDLANRRALTAA